MIKYLNSSIVKDLLAIHPSTNEYNIHLNATQASTEQCTGVCIHVCIHDIIYSLFMYVYVEICARMYVSMTIEKRNIGLTALVSYSETFVGK